MGNHRGPQGWFVGAGGAKAPRVYRLLMQRSIRSAKGSQAAKNPQNYSVPNGMRTVEELSHFYASAALPTAAVARNVLEGTSFALVACDHSGAVERRRPITCKDSCGQLQLIENVRTGMVVEPEAVR